MVTVANMLDATKEIAAEVVMALIYGRTIWLYKKWIGAIVLQVANKMKTTMQIINLEND